MGVALHFGVTAEDVRKMAKGLDDLTWLAPTQEQEEALEYAATLLTEIALKLEQGIVTSQ